MIFMGLVEHAWNTCLPVLEGLGGLCVTFDWVPMCIFAVCARGTCVLPQRWVDFRVVGGKLNYYLALCRNTPMVQIGQS